MAQKVQVLLVDDLDRGEADETISFALDGANYEIDLSGDNAKKLRDAFSPFVDSARKAGRPQGGRGRQRLASNRERSTDIHT